MSQPQWGQDLQAAVEAAADAGVTLEHFVEALAWELGTAVTQFAANEQDA